MGACQRGGQRPDSFYDIPRIPFSHAPGTFAAVGKSDEIPLLNQRRPSEPRQDEIGLSDLLANRKTFYDQKDTIGSSGVLAQPGVRVHRPRARTARADRAA